MFHAKDDPNVPDERTKEFSKVMGAKFEVAQPGRAHQHGLRGQKILGADQEVLRVGLTKGEAF